MATVFYRPQALESIARRTLSEFDALYLNGSPRAVPIETIILEEVTENEYDKWTIRQHFLPKHLRQRMGYDSHNL